MLFDQQRFMRLSDHIWRSSFQKILGIWPFSCDMCKYIHYYLYSIDCACIVCHSGAQKQTIVQLYIDIASSNTTLPNNWLFIFFFYTIFFHFSICIFRTFQTDDCGVFDTTLSKEFVIAANTFNLSKEDLIQLSKTAIEHSFGSDDEKQLVLEKIENFRNSYKDI